MQTFFLLASWWFGGWVATKTLRLITSLLGYDAIIWFPYGTKKMAHEFFLWFLTLLPTASITCHFASLYNSTLMIIRTAVTWDWALLFQYKERKECVTSSQTSSLWLLLYPDFFIESPQTEDKMYLKRILIDNEWTFFWTLKSYSTLGIEYLDLFFR